MPRRPRSPCCSTSTACSRCRGRRCPARSVGTEDILTAAAITAAFLRDRYPGARCLLLNSGDIADGLAGVGLVEDDPDVVVIGGAGPKFGYQALNRASGSPVCW